MSCGRLLLHENGYICNSCQSAHHYFKQGRAALLYEGDMRLALFQLKFFNRRDHVEFFGTAMAACIASRLDDWRAQLILPVPMFRKKEKARGFNQAELLAREISRHTGIPYSKKYLKCEFQSADQKMLTHAERMRNLKGIFSVRDSFPQVKRVILVDDVYTSGATMDELARTLLKVGVEEVYFVVLCIKREAY